MEESGSIPSFYPSRFIFQTLKEKLSGFDKASFLGFLKDRDELVISVELEISFV